MVGSCHGLICLLNLHTDEMVLWNPWIQKCYSVLPYPPHEYTTSGSEVPLTAAFVYDHVNDDYKVVKWFLEPCPYHDYSLTESQRYELCVYSLKLNSWRRLGNVIPFELPEYYYFFSEDCAFANGALHWFVRDYTWFGERFIVAFDIGSEEFRKISCGPCLVNPQYPYYQKKLCNLNGCLALLCCYSSSRNKGYAVELWVMEEYGVEMSWTKLATITIDGHWDLLPVAFLKKRRQLLLQIGYEKLVLYDLEKKSFRDVAITGEETKCIESCLCIGSFVRP